MYDILLLMYLVLSLSKLNKSDKIIHKKKVPGAINLKKETLSKTFPC